MPSGCTRLMWMLPSPRWPNGTQRMPGTSRWQTSVERRISSGTFDTGTETSFLTEAPARFCASECSSRRRQSWARCAPLSAITASARRRPPSPPPAPLPARRAARRPRAASPARPARKAGAGVASGSVLPGMCRSTSSTPSADMYSYAWIAASSCCCSRWNRSSAASGEGTAHSATAVSRGRG